MNKFFPSKTIDMLINLDPQEYFQNVMLNNKYNEIIQLKI
jgi:hypothetical protein